MATILKSTKCFEMLSPYTLLYGRVHFHSKFDDDVFLQYRVMNFRNTTSHKPYFTQKHQLQHFTKNLFNNL